MPLLRATISVGSYLGDVGRSVSKGLVRTGSYSGGPPILPLPALLLTRAVSVSRTAGLRACPTSFYPLVGGTRPDDGYP